MDGECDLCGDPIDADSFFDDDESYIVDGVMMCTACFSDEEG